MDKKSLTLIIDFEIYAHLFKPIVEELVSRKILVQVFSPHHLLPSVKEHFGESPSLQYHSLDALKKRHRFRFLIHRVASLLFTRTDFSFQFAKKRNQINVASKGIQRFLHKLSRFTPKVPNPKINGFLHALSGFGLKNPFPTQKVMIGSLNASPELLGAKGMQVYTVMESWDHPVKVPNGYRSAMVYVWNQELGEDWESCQGDHQWQIFYPLKLRYAIENSHDSTENGRVSHEENRPLCVYAVASTDKFSGSTIVDLEKRILSDLCVATQNAHWDFLIKSRPNGREGEFQKYSQKYSHVQSTSVLDDDIEEAANYTLTDEYNKRRFDEIKNASLVINAFTTFGLDAAVAGFPVLQLDLQKATDYEDSDQIYGNNHIRKYLLKSENVFRVVDEGLVDAATKYLQEASLDSAAAYSRELSDWLIPEISAADAVRNIVDHVLSDGA